MYRPDNLKIRMLPHEQQKNDVNNQNSAANPARADATLTNEKPATNVTGFLLSPDRGKKYCPVQTYLQQPRHEKGNDMEVNTGFFLHLLFINPVSYL